MISVAVNFRIDCPACDERVALRSLSSPVTCSACKKPIPIGLEQWRELVDRAVNDGPKLPPGRSEPNDRTDDFDTGEFARREVRCRGCENLLPVDALLASSSTVTCEACGAVCSSRPVPRELAPLMTNVTRVVSEDLSGASDAIDSHVFYLLCDVAVRAAGGRAMIPWSSFADCVADADGNLYMIAADSRGASQLAVFSLDPKQRTRWIRTDLKCDDNSQLVLTDGVLLVWNPRRHSFLKLASADGKDLGKLGGAQPAGATIHHLDLKDASDVASDPTDGTIVVLNQERLLRYDASGTGVTTWPSRKGFLGRKITEKSRPLGTPLPEDARSVETVNHQPLAVSYAKVHIGFDGFTYLLSDRWLARFDRTGKRIYRIELPRPQERICADAAGNAYVLGGIESETDAILRITPDGTITLHVDGRAAATPLRDERRLSVLPDGTAICTSSYASLRIFAPDGSLRTRSAGAQEADTEREAERAERIANDEE